MPKPGSKTAAKPGSEAEAAPAASSEVGGVVYVNRDKLERAKDILALVSGKRAPNTDSEADRKERFSTLFATHEKSPKDGDALQFVYETLLGGLVRTPAEQEDATDAAAAARKKINKKRVEG